MSIAFVQGAIGADLGSSSASSTSVTLSGAVTSGNAVVGSLVYYGGGTLTITDDKGNAYTVVNTSTSLYTYYALNLTNGPSTITATGSVASTFWRIIADEFSGITAIDASVDVAFSGVSGTNAITTGLVTTIFNGEVIYGSLCAVGPGYTLNAGTGFTITETGNFATDHQPLGSEYLTQVNAGAIAATFSPGSAAGGQVAVMTFVPTIPGPGLPQQSLLIG
jgi:hypothetical protein